MGTCVLLPLFCLLSAARESVGDSALVVKFGIITDVHYANAPTIGTRHFNDSLAKVRDALHDISEARADFLVQLGDLKDTDASQHCADKVQPSEHCVNATIGFLREIEAVVEAGFDGPMYHLLGNHDVDILDQKQVLAEVHNTNTPSNPIIAGNTTEGYFAFNAPSAALPVGPDTASLRFLVLNADFTNRGIPWADVDGPDAADAGMFWDTANVPMVQLTWLANQLFEASDAGQRVIVFVHYRLDGRAHGPVGTPIPVPSGNRAWIDQCTLENAAAVRAVLEAKPGLVLATFSGHDHNPNPSYTHIDGKPLYATLSGMVEGAYADGRNAYSLVSIFSDCSVVLRGWGDQSNITVKGPSGCSIGSPGFVV